MAESKAPGQQPTPPPPPDNPKSKRFHGTSLPPLKQERGGAFSDGINQPENAFAIGRMINNQGAAEGTILPPRQGGELRVPLVTGLKVVRTTRYFGQTQVTLVWDQPEIVPTQLSHFNIYITGLLPDGQQPQGPTSVQKSPAQVLVTTKVPVVAVFTVQTVLKSGLMSKIDTSPSVSAPIGAGSFTPSDYPPGTIPLDALADGVPGEMISWDVGGVITTVPAGTTNQLLTAQGATPPIWQSTSALGLVTGAGSLTTPNALVIVASAGTITESSVLVTDVITGAPMMTNAGNIPFVDNPVIGSLRTTSAFAYDEPTDTLNAINIVTTRVNYGYSETQMAEVLLTPADITDFLANPVSVIAAPGPNKVINILRVFAWLTFNTTPYLNGGGGDAILTFDGATSQTASPLTAMFLSTGPGQMITSLAPVDVSESFAGGLLENTPMLLNKETADFTAGDSDVHIRVFYSVEEIY